MRRRLVILSFILCSLVSATLGTLDAVGQAQEEADDDALGDLKNRQIIRKTPGGSRIGEEENKPQSNVTASSGRGCSLVP